MIFTVGTVPIPDPHNGKTMGVVDICKGDDGSVWLRVNRYGMEVTVQIAPELAKDIATLIEAASEPFKEGCAV